MGRKGPRAKTKIVLKSVNQWEQLGNMHNLKFQTFLNKNHPSNQIFKWKHKGGTIFIALLNLKFKCKILVSEAGLAAGDWD